MPTYAPMFYRDVERCPYLPKDFGYDSWVKRDRERLEQIDKNRAELLEIAKKYKYSYQGDEIRKMALFAIEMLDRD